MRDRSDVLSLSRPTAATVSGRRRRAAIQRFLPLAVLGLGVFVAPLLLVSSGGLHRLDQLAAEREAVKLEISRLTRRVEHLRAEARGLKEDPRVVERAARDQLGLVRQTEIVLQFETPRRTP